VHSYGNVFREASASLARRRRSRIAGTTWAPFTATWDSGTATSARLEIKDLTMASSGDDFGLDDITLVGPCPGARQTYGAGLAGTGGLVPVLGGSGCPARGQRFTLETSNGRGGTAGLLVIGSSRASIPLLGGTLLVDVLGVSTGIAVTLTGASGQAGRGAASVPIQVPDAAALTGSSMHMQGLLLDPAASAGVAMTAGLT
jgi:hypothetical protein